MTTAMPLRLHGVTKAYRGRTVLGPIDLTLEAGRVYGLIGENGAGKSAFSMGMRRRLDLAVALLGDPELVVMDEPVNGLDPTGIIEVRELVRRVNRERGTTFLVSSHILPELAEVATDYVVVSQGRLAGTVPARDAVGAASLEALYGRLVRGGDR